MEDLMRLHSSVQFIIRHPVIIKGIYFVFVWNLPFYLSAFQRDNQTRLPCTNVRQHSMRQLMYLMGLQKTDPNNDVHDDVLIDIVVYEQLFCGVTSNRQVLKHLQKYQHQIKVIKFYCKLSGGGFFHTYIHLCWWGNVDKWCARNDSIKYSHLCTYLWLNNDVTYAGEWAHKCSIIFEHAIFWIRVLIKYAPTHIKVTLAPKKRMKKHK